MGSVRIEISVREHIVLLVRATVGVGLDILSRLLVEDEVVLVVLEDKETEDPNVEGHACNDLSHR